MPETSGNLPKRMTVVIPNDGYTVDQVTGQVRRKYPKFQSKKERRKRNSKLKQ